MCNKSDTLIYNMPLVLYNLLLNEKIWTKRVTEMRFIV